MTTCHLLLYLLISAVLSFSIGSARESADECVYTLYVKTGQGIKTGTDSKIGITLGDASGRSVWIPNLKQWGLMGISHDYYERDNLDMFSGRAPCIGVPICSLNVTSDGSGYHPGWYCEYIEVTSTGAHRRCSQTMFNVNRWLSTDAPPYELSAVIDGCRRNVDGRKIHDKNNLGAIMVGHYKAFGFE